MTIERRAELYELWSSETEAPETQEWRDHLSLEELDAVAQWDIGYAACLRKTTKTIMIRQLIRDRYTAKEIWMVEDIGDHCRLWLRDGAVYLARLTQDRLLQLDAIDCVC